jgi:hypothetical protein
MKRIAKNRAVSRACFGSWNQNHSNNFDEHFMCVARVIRNISLIVCGYRLARHRLTRRQAAERGVFQFANKQFRI